MIDCRGGAAPPTVKRKVFENAGAENRTSGYQALRAGTEMETEGLGFRVSQRYGDGDGDVDGERRKKRA